MNPAEIFSEVGKKIFKKTLKKMFENEVHCFLTTQCFQLLNCIESHRIVLNRFYQHASFLVSYRAHVSRYESDRLCHERFTPLVWIHSSYKQYNINTSGNLYLLYLLYLSEEFLRYTGLVSYGLVVCACILFSTLLR